MGKEEDKKLFEKVLKINERYYTKFRELILLNRGKGRDYHVLCDYLECRDAELKGTRGEGEELYNYLKTYRFNYLSSDNLFEMLEKKVRERLNGEG